MVSLFPDLTVCNGILTLIFILTHSFPFFSLPFRDEPTAANEAQPSEFEATGEAQAAEADLRTTGQQSIAVS